LKGVRKMNGFCLCCEWGFFRWHCIGQRKEVLFNHQTKTNLLSWLHLLNTKYFDVCCVWNPFILTPFPMQRRSDAGYLY
jgi:hypothetical protein